MNVEAGISPARNSHLAAARPHIAFLVTHSHVGGAQALWDDLAGAFQARGYPVRLMALYPDGEESQPVRAMPWSYVAERRRASPIAQAQLVAKLARRLREDRTAVLVTALPYANCVGPIAAALAGIGTKVVTTHHSPADTHNPALSFVDTLTGMLPCVSSVVAVSAAVQESLKWKTRSYRRKCRVIRNAAPPHAEEILEQLAATRSPNISSRVVVATGRLHQQKNYGTLVQAMALLPDVCLRIVGSGPEEKVLQDEVARLRIGDRITFLGQCSRERTLQEVSDASVFVQPSRYEGHSLALIEAAKLGLPLVVSDAPTQLEGITRRDGVRCGLVAGCEDPPALAAAIRELFESADTFDKYSQLSKSLGGECRFEDVVDRYEALFSVCGTPGARRIA